MYSDTPESSQGTIQELQELYNVKEQINHYINHKSKKIAKQLLARLPDTLHSPTFTTSH
jgi:hypothetical protein